MQDHLRYRMSYLHNEWLILKNLVINLGGFAGDDEYDFVSDEYHARTQSHSQFWQIWVSAMMKSERENRMYSEAAQHQMMVDMGLAHQWKAITQYGEPVEEN